MNITKALNFNATQQKISAKSVLQQFHQIPITITRYFTDVNGTIVAKGTVPVAMQTRYPVFVLGEFDRQGGYLTGRKAVPPDLATPYLLTFINGMGNTSFSVTGQNGLNTIQGMLKAGDVVIVYTDSILAPTYYVWFVLSTIPVSMAAVLSNSATTQNDKRLGRLTVYEINYVVSDASQFSEDFHFTRYDNIGNFTDNQVQPLGIYRSIMDKQRDVITLKTYFDIEQFLGINFYMLFACDSLRMELKIYKK